MKQGTPEWFAARLGCVTASRISDVMAKGKGGAESATRRNYLYQIAAERVSGQSVESFSNAAIQWGIENEPLARLAYEAETGLIVDEVGMINHPSISMAGASPDGFVGKDGLIEIKCPNTATHIDTVLNGTIKTEYMYQIQWQIECTGREWCDFVSYDLRLGATSSALKIIRVERDEAMIEKISNEVRLFLDEVQSIVKKL